jgi:hypothetical protein
MVAPLIYKVCVLVVPSNVERSLNTLKFVKVTPVVTNQLALPGERNSKSVPERINKRVVAVLNASDATMNSVPFFLASNSISHSICKGLPVLLVLAGILVEMYLPASKKE